jgi:hypothetical protein
VSPNYCFALNAILCRCIVHGIASVLGICLICRLIATQWDPDIKGLCGNEIASFVAIEVTGMALDVAMLVSPLPVMYHAIGEKWERLKNVIILDIGVV